MYFGHSTEIWRDYPELVPGVLLAEGITKDTSAGPQTAKFNTIAESRLAMNSEAELPEVQAWRRVFSRMGLQANAVSMCLGVALATLQKGKVSATAPSRDRPM